MIAAKQRHWCLTAWLILLILAYSLVVLSDLFLMIPGTHPLLPSLARTVLTYALVSASIATANLVFLAALLRWKKWGFFGLVGTSILLVVINLIRIHIIRPLGLGRALIPLLNVIILYAVLQIGKEKTGWVELE